MEGKNNIPESSENTKNVNETHDGLKRTSDSNNFKSDDQNTGCNVTPTSVNANLQPDTITDITSELRSDSNEPILRSRTQFTDLGKLKPAMKVKSSNLASYVNESEVFQSSFELIVLLFFFIHNYYHLNLWQLICNKNDLICLYLILPFF